MHFFNQGVQSVHTSAISLDGFEIQELEAVLREGKTANNQSIFEAHRGSEYTLLYVDKGAGWIELDFKRQNLHPGAFLFIAPHQMRKFDAARMIGGFMIRFSTAFIESNQDPQISLVLSRLFDDRHKILDARRHRELVMYFEMLLKEYNHAKDQLRRSVINATLRLLMLHADRLYSASIVNADKKEIGYRYYLSFRENIPTMLRKTRNASDFADALGISYKYLNDLTRRFAGCTPKELVDRSLINEAKRLVIEGDKSIGQISRNLGFDEPTNFRKYFKKHTGANPTAFRQRSLS